MGLKEGISYENPEIQSAIDAKFASEQELVIQQNKNEANLAKAEAEAIRIAAEAEAAANKTISESLTDEVLQKMYFEAWNGKLPTVVGGNGDYILPSDILEEEEESNP